MEDIGIVAIPKLIREILFAPPCPPDVASLFEVATVYHSSGQYQVCSHIRVTIFNSVSSRLINLRMQKRSGEQIRTVHSLSLLYEFFIATGKNRFQSKENCTC